MADLTTLVAVKAWLRETAVNADRDALLARMITAYSALVESFLNRHLLSASYTLTLDGNDRSRVFVPDYPITAVSQVKVDYVAIAASVNGSTGYVFDEHSIGLINGRFTRGMLNVYVAFTAGYAATPPDIEQVVVDTVGLRYKELDRIGLLSKGLAGETIAYSVRDFSPASTTTLKQWRRVVPV